MLLRPQMKRSGAEKPDQSNDDQIDRDNIVEHARHDQNQDAGKQRNNRGEAYVHVHHRFEEQEFSLRLSDALLK